MHIKALKFDNKMTTENCTVHILWIFQITKITRAKSPIQNCLNCGFRERVGIVPLGLDVPKKPVFMRVSGLGTFRVTVFATDEIVTLGLQLNLKIA